MDGIINRTSSINNHPLNRGLVADFGRIGTITQAKGWNAAANSSHMTIGSGCTTSLLGPTGSAMKFSSSSLTVPASVFAKINGVGKIAIALWIRPTSFGSYKSVFDTTNRHASFYIDSATGLYVAFGGSAVGATSSVNFTLNEWQHVIVTYDGFNVSIYRNGFRVATAALGLLAFTDSLLFGTNPSGGGSNYQGHQSGWRVYSRYFNQGAAAALYQQARVGYRDLYSRLRTPDGPATTVSDTLTAQHGVYSLSGQDASLTYTPAGSYTITPEHGVFAMSGQSAVLDYAPASSYSLQANAGMYALSGQDAILTYNDGVSDPTTSCYVGRYTRGEKVCLSLVCSDLPDACPTVDFWRNGTTNVATDAMPQADGNVFILNKYLSSSFLDGSYIAVISYSIDGNESVHIRYFEVIGGSGVGHVINLHELRRPLGRAVVTHNQDGSFKIGYNPRVE